MKLSIVIPVFNEAATVGELLERVWTAPLLPDWKRELVVIESNSRDDSRRIVQDFARGKADVKVLLQAEARGKGYAMREALGAATGDVVLIQDGDLEYDVKDYPLLLQPIADGRADFVLGSRHLAAANWKIRRFRHAWFLNLGGSLFHAFFNFIYGVKLTDPTTMYKVFRRSCLKGLSFSSNRFDFDFELVAKLIRSGYLPIEVPVSYRSRGFEEGKKVRIFRDPLTWLWAIVKFRFQRI